MQISNRPGPDCELTVRIKFPDLDRFRADYRDQIAKGEFFIKSSRSKPKGTRLQIIFVIEDVEKEVWSWGLIQSIHTPAEAAVSGEDPGIGLQLMDITPKRRSEIEQLFATDEAVEAIKLRHSSPPSSSGGGAAGYTQVARDPRHELVERAQELIALMNREADHYEMLGVSRAATYDEIREAYRERTRRYHPDRFVRRIPEHIHEELDKAFQQTIEAQRILTDEDSRATYDTSIGNYANPRAQRAAMPHVRLQRQFRKAYSSIVETRSPKVKMLMEDAHKEYLADQYKLAYSKLKLAQALDPLNPEIKKKMDEIKVYVEKENAAAEKEAEAEREKMRAEAKKKEAERRGH